jgi:hypothetical protein
VKFGYNELGYNELGYNEQILGEIGQFTTKINHDIMNPGFNKNGSPELFVMTKFDDA